METLVDPSYTVVADCHFCGLPVPGNIFRGAINGRLNDLSLQKVHTVPEAFSSDSKSWSECHTYCLKLDHGYEWSDSILMKAKATIASLLSLPLDTIWAPKLGAFCITEGCCNSATAGPFLEHCTMHSNHE